MKTSFVIVVLSASACAFAQSAPSIQKKLQLARDGVMVADLAADLQNAAKQILNGQIAAPQKAEEPQPTRMPFVDPATELSGAATPPTKSVRSANARLLGESGKDCMARLEGPNTYSATGKVMRRGKSMRKKAIDDCGLGGGQDTGYSGFDPSAPK